jgi:hypothetical protein
MERRVYNRDVVQASGTNRDTRAEGHDTEEQERGEELKSISSTFYEQLLRQYSCAKKLQSPIVAREKLCKTLS